MVLKMESISSSRVINCFFFFVQPDVLDHSIHTERNNQSNLLRRTVSNVTKTCGPTHLYVYRYLTIKYVKLTVKKASESLLL